MTIARVPLRKQSGRGKVSAMTYIPPSSLSRCPLVPLNATHLFFPSLPGFSFASCSWQNQGEGAPRFFPVSPAPSLVSLTRRLGGEKNSVDLVSMAEQSLVPGPVATAAADGSVPRETPSAVAAEKHNYGDLAPEAQLACCEAIAAAMVAADEKALFALLNGVADFDAAIAAMAPTVKKVLKTRHGVDDPLGVEDFNGDTCLHFAARQDHGNVLRLFYRVGLLKEINQYFNREGNTPLHDAVSRGRVMMVKQLLFLGADPKARNREGKTPASMARNMHNPEMVAAFRECPMTLA